MRSPLHLHRLSACSTFLLILLCTGSLLAGAAETAGDGECASKLKAQESDLALDYDGFDQTPGKGWRLLAQAGCRRQAAELIQKYLQGPAELTETNRRNLSFHAGQVLAMDNDYEEAIPLFQAALKDENEAADAPFQWNAYVNATIAFLKRDRAGLESNREIMARAGEVNGRAPNLQVVDALLQNFDKSYKVAYSTR